MTVPGGVGGRVEARLRDDGVSASSRNASMAAASSSAGTGRFLAGEANLSRDGALCLPRNLRRTTSVVPPPAAAAIAKELKELARAASEEEESSEQGVGSQTHLQTTVLASGTGTKI